MVGFYVDKRRDTIVAVDATSRRKVNNLSSNYIMTGNGSCLEPTFDALPSSQLLIRIYSRRSTCRSPHSVQSDAKAESVRTLIN